MTIRGFRIAAAAVLFAFVFPPYAAALTLENQRVSTTIDGVPVELFISGPVTLDLQDGAVTVDVDATLDLRDVQNNFPAILRARSVAAACGNSIAIDSARIRPAGDGGRMALVEGNVTIRQTACGSNGTPTAAAQLTAGAIAVSIAARADANQRLAFDVTVNDTTAPAVKTLLRDATLANALTTMLTGAIGVGASNAVAPLSPEAASYEPRVRSAGFQTVDGALGARIAVRLQVPVAKIFEWKVNR